MTPGDGRDPAHADRERAGPSPEDGRAETYLRLRAEAELRRALTLPRHQPPQPPVLPASLRLAAAVARPAASAIASAARPVLPLAERTAEALRPLADNAARAAQPLADEAARRLQPLADEAARRLQPLAEDAARTVRPLADRAAAAVLPLADEAARRLRRLGWQAAGWLQMPRYYAPQVLREWRWRAQGMIATVGRRSPPPVPGPEPSAEDGVHRLRTMAHALNQAGAIDRGTADSIVSELETALAVRSRIDPHRLALRELRAWHHQRSAGAPAGPYLAAPIGVAVQPPSDSGLAELRLFTLVLAPDQAVLSAAGRVARPHGGSPDLDSWLVSGPGQPGATDDRGNRYRFNEGSSQRDSDGDWSGFLMISPIPPPGIAWLELTLSPGSPAIRVDLTGLGGERGTASAPAGGPAERLIDAAAVDLLHQAVALGDEGLPCHDLSSAADVVTALDAVGALAPARGAVGRLRTLAGRLGVEVPAALSAAAEPADLPADWASALENRGRRDGPRGGTPAAAVLPELDGARIVLAGLRSEPAGAKLNVLAWGWDYRPSPFVFSDAAGPWSWSARDDTGRWHIAADSGGSFSDDHAALQLELVPPLHPDATSLEVTLAGPTGQVTVTVPLDWGETG
jgi:hypothetical protein